MAVELIALDMDGTLLNPQSRMTDFTRDTLREAIHKGIKVVLATGRIHGTASKKAREIGVNAPIISCNGAHIQDEETVYRNAFFTEDQYDRIITLIGGEKQYFHIFTDEYIYLLRENVCDFLYQRWVAEMAQPEKYIRFCDDLQEIILQTRHRCSKVLLVVEEPEKLERIQKKAEENNLTIVKSDVDTLEFTPAGISKGNALEYLAKLYEIPHHNILAIGDGENDISLLNNAGISVAMGNAFDSLKRLADYVTVDNGHDGAALAIRKFAL